MGGGCQGGWERRIEAFVKIQKKMGGGRVGLGGGGVWSGGQGGCEQRSEVFVKIQKKKWGGVGVEWGREGGGPIRGWGGGVGVARFGIGG